MRDHRAPAPTGAIDLDLDAIEERRRLRGACSPREARATFATLLFKSSRLPSPLAAPGAGVHAAAAGGPLGRDPRLPAGCERTPPCLSSLPRTPRNAPPGRGLYRPIAALSLLLVVTWLSIWGALALELLRALGRGATAVRP